MAKSYLIIVPYSIFWKTKMHRNSSQLNVKVVSSGNNSPYNSFTTESHVICQSVISTVSAGWGRWIMNTGGFGGCCFSYPSSFFSLDINYIQKAIVIISSSPLPYCPPSSLPTSPYYTTACVLMKIFPTL